MGDLISSNELLEDIGTGDLRFLGVDFYLGELELLRSGPAVDRMDVVSKAKRHLDSFISTCKVTGLTSREDEQYLEQQLCGGIKDAQKRREEKLARFKREKLAKQKIKDLQERVSTSNSRNTSSDDSALDDDLDRSLVLATLDLCLQKALDSLGLTTDEMGLLAKMRAARITDEEKQKHAEGTRADHRERSRGIKDGRTDWKLDVAGSSSNGKNGPLLSSDGKPLRPFIITSERERLREGVFKPDWPLPTMSIDEYLEIERQRGNILTGGGEQPEKEEIDDNDEAALDAELLKQRKFDDFKDSVRRGSGNRHRKG
ncbi:TAP42-domain-containing protein [Gonapodya prolifera JEL478]|uniref:TAP42-domain-containing protein n=1 Tax=Gonapodya prolifera (strain JEL478) TaxID=1344416 RepID=A0A139A4C8_GONPJ|nr:TAP42-domain-containing protein [Gonapodya prolifera JEL478]|eukprot:KXS11448.1 TAP42-domain-containing protein [Gonapodya prolifera JEL478]